MPDELTRLLVPRRPTAERPLFGLTVLVVEDSRFASEAMRLLCLRSGARIRRADTLASARRHLSLYRPNAVIVDCGLPDGAGCDLIAELHAAEPRVPVLLGISGASEAEAEALAAGAQGFLVKPIIDLGSFQAAILTHLPEDMRPRGPRALPDETVRPDPIALKDDLAHVIEVMAGREDDSVLDYVAQFLSSVARSAHDSDLARAASSLRDARHDTAASTHAVAHVENLVRTRLAAAASF